MGWAFDRHLFNEQGADSPHEHSYPTKSKCWEMESENPQNIYIMPTNTEETLNALMS